MDLRLLLAAKPDALSAIGRLFIQEIRRWQRQQAEALGLEQAEGAAVSFCQRFGSSLNLNIHWHVIVPDALFVPDAGSERVRTLRHRAPTRLDLEEVVTAVAVRAVRWIAKHGYVREDGSDDLAGSSEVESPWLRCLRGSLGVGELQRWTEHPRLDESSEPAQSTRSPPRPSKGLGAQYLRFNLHAGVSIPGGLPAARERLLRYCARPPLALERLSVLDDGRICYRIKDTDQVRLMTPMQFMARLAALVPPPATRSSVIRSLGPAQPVAQPRGAGGSTPDTTRRHGAERLAPSPCPPAERLSVAVTRSTRSGTAPPQHSNADPSASKPNLASSRPDTPSVAAMPIAASAPLAPAREVADELRFARLSRLAWATLYARVFYIDPLECARCGAIMRFVEVLEDLTRARSELRRRNLPAEPPPLSRARSPDWAD